MVITYRPPYIGTASASFAHPQGVKVGDLLDIDVRNRASAVTLGRHQRAMHFFTSRLKMLLERGTTIASTHGSTGADYPNGGGAVRSHFGPDTTGLSQQTEQAGDQSSLQSRESVQFLSRSPQPVIHLGVREGKSASASGSGGRTGGV
jgi:hypothetical protein